MFYKEAEIKSKTVEPLKYRKSGENNNIRFYTEEFLIQFTNSTYCDIQLMMLYEDRFCFNRNSSTPLEHTFGRSRVRSKDINTLSRFVKSIGKTKFKSVANTKYEPGTAQVKSYTNKSKPCKQDQRKIQLFIKIYIAQKILTKNNDDSRFINNNFTSLLFNAQKI